MSKKPGVYPFFGSARRFVEECIYRIRASGDAELSSPVRAIDDDIKPIYTEKRPSRSSKGDRDILSWGGMREVHDLARKCAMRKHCRGKSAIPHGWKPSGGFSIRRFPSTR